MKTEAKYDDGNPPYEILKPSDSEWQELQYQRIAEKMMNIYREEMDKTILFFAE